MRFDHNTVRAKIASLDLEPIKFKLILEHGLSTEQVQLTEKWYRRFLFLTYKYPDRPIVPSKEVDDFWHQHILDTRNYARDCEAVFGYFLHHFPYFGLRGAKDEQELHEAFTQTLELTRVEYGETPLDSLAGLREERTHAAVCSDCRADCSSEPSNSKSAADFDRRPRILSVTTN